MTIAGGTVSATADANLGPAPGSPTSGSLVLNGGVLEATASFTLNANRGIALGPPRLVRVQARSKLIPDSPSPIPAACSTISPVLAVLTRMVMAA